MESLLEIQNLNKSYKKSDFQLSDISLTLEPNEVIGIIGKNGSGKSTLINTLVGNRFKDSGEIRYFDKSIAANDNQHKEHIGVVFDDLRVPNKLTIQDIDKVFSKIYKTWDSEKFFAIIKNFELPTTNEIASFSRGMRMKTALTIALSHDSKVLILDEATAGMDVSSREEVIEILEDYVAKGNGILISSHISEDIEQLATKLVFMKNGEIILEEKKDKLFNHYGIVEQDKEELNIPNDILIASRVRKGSRISLINDRTAVTDAHPLENIDDAIKLIMRGDS